MSMISEQIKYLESVKDEIGRHHDEGWAWTVQVIDEAVSTIQELSAKLAAANMERSSAYYNGGWIPVEERLPEFTVVSGSGDKDLSEKMLASIVYGDGSTDITISRCHRDDKWTVEFFSVPKCKVTAWMPLPEPYRKAEKGM